MSTKPCSVSARMRKNLQIHLCSGLCIKMWTQDAMPSRCTDHQQKDWCLVYEKAWKYSPKSWHQNQSIRIMTGRNPTQVLLLSCLGTLFLLDFSPVCVGPAWPGGWLPGGRPGDGGTGLSTHTLYIDLTPGARTLQSDTTHSQDKVASTHSPLIYTCHSQHIWWPQVKKRENSFSQETFVINIHVTSNCHVKSFQAVNGTTQLIKTK